MNQNVITLLIVIGTCALIALAVYLRKYLTAKKIDGDTTVEKGVSYANVAEAFALAIAPFLPAKYGNILSKLAVAAFKSVNTVEALWKASVLPEDKRKATATSLIQSELTQAGIPVDDEVNKLISVSVDLMCRFLPKSHAVIAATTPGDGAEVNTTPAA